MICLPILFSGEMVRAILDGRKTQTRRAMRPQPGDDAIITVGEIGTSRVWVIEFKRVVQ